jgi:hypothetical protein
MAWAVALICELAAATGIDLAAFGAQGCVLAETLSDANVKRRLHVGRP